jgi:aspartate kinase
LQECQDLNAFLAAAQRIGEISPKSFDRIVSKGELLSATFLAALLQDQGIDSEVVDLSDIVGVAAHDGLGQDFYAQLAAEVGSRITACGEKVPVVTGFFGVVPGGLLCLIGRGYTDLCAALVAIGLGAQELQVWKEVDGIFTASVRLSAHHSRC